MRLLVTGARGMLGRELVALLERDHAVTAVDLEVDVTEAGAVDACVEAVRPEAVLHCAAWTDVDGAEGHEADALRVNADGARNVARAAARHGAPLVYPSTDYVFDGRAGRAYREDDPPAPLSAYGRTKLAGERAAIEVHPDGVRVARTAWLYGAGGRNFVDTMRGLGAERDEVAVVCDQVGCPTWARDLAPALMALVVQPPGVYHTAAAGEVSWAGVARRIFERLGLDCRVREIATAELDRPALRPAHSPLVSTRPGAPRLRPWQAALDDYLQEVAA